MWESCFLEGSFLGIPFRALFAYHTLVVPIVSGGSRAATTSRHRVQTFHRKLSHRVVGILCASLGCTGNAVPLYKQGRQSLSVPRLVALSLRRLAGKRDLLSHCLVQACHPKWCSVYQ